MTTNSTLPPIDQTPAVNPLNAGGNNVAISAQPFDPAIVGGTGPSTKDIAIGVGVLLVAAVLFFFIRQGYVNWLVSSHKRAPNNASLAGWGLFGALFFGAAIGCIGLISASFFALPFVIPLASLSLVCLVICVFSSIKR